VDPKRKEFVLHQETLSRRSLLEWMGKATVLSLSGSYLAACLDSGPGLEFGAGEGEPGPDADALGDADALAERDVERAAERELGPSDFPFEEGQRAHEVYGGWGERTVDRQDLAQILASWKLTVGGLVESSIELSFADLVALPRQDQVTDFHCVEGWSIYDVPWNGVHLDRIVELVRPAASATHVVFWTVGRKYNESLPIDVALEPKTLLGYGVGGSTLPLSHGFPLRVVIPRLLAYKNAKYIDGLEFTDHPVNGYWVDAGYPYDGEVPERRLREGKY